MTPRKISDLPDFEGKALALEVQQLGVELDTGITVASDLMVLGMVQIIARLQKEFAEFKSSTRIYLTEKEIKTIVDNATTKEWAVLMTEATLKAKQ